MLRQYDASGVGSTHEVGSVGLPVLGVFQTPRRGFGLGDSERGEIVVLVSLDYSISVDDNGQDGRK